MSSSWKLSLRVFLTPLVLLTALAWAGGSDAAQLSSAWTDTSSNEDGFKIERKIGTSGTFTQIATVGKNLTAYTDAGLATATTYCYRVRAYNTAGNSAYSNETCGTTAHVSIGIFRPSTGKWYLDLNGNGKLDSCTIDACLGPFGQPGNRPVVGDWAGTGTAQIGIFDSSTLLWKLDRNGNDSWDGCSVDSCLGPFGTSGDLPVVGRWKTGSSTDLIGIYHPSKRGSWYLDRNGNGKLDSCTVDGCLGTFGRSTDLPVAGDWTGMGTTQIGVFTASTGLWKLDRNGNGKLDSCTVDGCLGPFGLSGDLPVAGDWTGTGTAKIGVFDPSAGQWELDLNGNGLWDGCAVDACLGPFGQPGDLPVVGKW